MKKAFSTKKLLILPILFFALISGCKQDTIQTVEVKVSGMVCNSCEKAIETKIAALEGVKSVKAVQKEGVVTVEWNGEVPLKTITNEIENLHYKVEGTLQIKTEL